MFTDKKQIKREIKKTAFRIMTLSIEDLKKHLAQVRLYEWEGVDALFPVVKHQAEQLVKMCQKTTPINITNTFRSADEQNALYAKGRTMKGKIITNAKGLESYHNFAIAFDIAFDPPLKPYPVQQDIWEKVGKLGESLGLIWGGRWSSFPDKPHFEYHPGIEWPELKKVFEKV